MRRFKILLLLLVFATAANAQEKKFLKWGDYQWEVNYKLDTVKQVIVTSQTGLAGNPTEKRTEKTVVDVTLQFADKGKYEVDLGVKLTDTVIILNPVTLEEKQEVNSYSKLAYQIKGGKIGAAEFRELATKKVLLPHVTYADKGSYEIECYTPGVGFCGWFRSEYPNSTFSAKLLKGCFALVSFNYHSGDERKTIGRIFFEII